MFRNATVRLIVIAIAAWMGLTAAFMKADMRAGISFAVMSPILASVVVVSLRRAGAVTTVFMLIAFVGHAIAAPFFFMREMYFIRWGGFGAVQSFDFSLRMFFEMYAWVIVLLVVAVTAAAFLGPNQAMWQAVPPDRSLKARTRSPSSPQTRRAGMMLLALVTLVLIPMNVFMYEHQIGITGVIAPLMPFRIVGILYYTRFFLAPLVLLIIYARTTRGPLTTGVLLLYAAVAGLAASSRFQLMINAAPVLLFCVRDRATTRLVVSLSVMAVAFALVTASRDFVYSGLHVSILDLVRLILGSGSATFVPIDVIGGIANRLWGPQDVVLASQYELKDSLAGLWNFVLLRPVIPDLGYELYGLSFPPGSGWGVGIGFIPWMLVLAARSWFTLLVLGIILGAGLAAVDLIVHTYTRRGGAYTSASWAAAFFIAYALHAAALLYVYQLITIAVVPITYWKLTQVLRRPAATYAA